MTQSEDGLRVVLIETSELDVITPQPFHKNSSEPLSCLLNEWATTNNLSVADFAYFSENGEYINEECLIGDLPRLNPTSKYVAIKCIKSEPITFQIYGYPQFSTCMKVTPYTTLESLEEHIRIEIPCISNRSFILLSNNFEPLSQSLLRHVSGKTEACWIDLKYNVKCLHLEIEEIIISELNGSDCMSFLLSPKSPELQSLVMFDENQQQHFVNKEQKVIELASKEIIDSEIAVLLVTKKTILVDDASKENTDLIPLHVWPTDPVKTLLSHPYYKRRLRHGISRHICFDGQRLDPNTLFCEICGPESDPILHLSKEIEVLYCDSSTQVHSVCLDSSAMVCDLRALIMNKLNKSSDEIMLKYNGLLLDCNNAMLYEFNIKDRSVVHVHYARLCFLVNQLGEKESLGYLQELDYPFIYRRACQFFNTCLSRNTIFKCKCGRTVASDEEQRKLSVDCCRPLHHRMCLTAHYDVAVRFLLNQDNKVYRIIVRNDQTLDFAFEKLFQTYLSLQRDQMRLLVSNCRVTIHEIQVADSSCIDVPLEQKFNIFLQVKKRTLPWTIWPSDFVSSVLEEVESVIGCFSHRKADFWIFKEKNITKPRNGECLEDLRFRDIGINQSDTLTLISVTPQRRRSISKQDAVALPRRTKPNITIVIGSNEFHYEVWDSDSAASLCSRLCSEKRLWNATSLETPHGGKIFPYEKKWWNAPVMGRVKPDLKKKLNIAEPALIRIVVIAISPSDHPISFFVKATKEMELTQLGLIKTELINRGIISAEQRCWITQVGRYFDIDRRQCHGVATIIGNKTCFISERGDATHDSSGIITITSISDNFDNGIILVPPFGDPKLEISVNVAFLKAGTSDNEDPRDVGSLEQCLSEDVFVHFRGIRIRGRHIVCPSLHSNSNINATTGFSVDIRSSDEAQGFVMAFDFRSLLPKWKIPANDEVRVYFRAGFQLTFSNGKFTAGQLEQTPKVHHCRWILAGRDSELTKSIGQYLKDI